MKAQRPGSVFSLLLWLRLRRGGAFFWSSCLVCEDLLKKHAEMMTQAEEVEQAWQYVEAAQAVCNVCRLLLLQHNLLCSHCKASALRKMKQQRVTRS